MNVTTVVDEGEVRGVNSFSFKRQPEVGLTKPGVHLLPVQMLLINDSLGSLGKYAILERKVLDSGTLQVGAVKSLLGEGGHPSEERRLLFIPLG